ncbi:SAM-dependent methyltransferase [Streptomyces sp. NPDC049597]|uniref:SAM-dependent methyltransferase n=1 Tax=Streptomyces sp. NPDC049597 TaxID=3155276 RepID=UPI0034276F55
MTLDSVPPRTRVVHLDNGPIVHAHGWAPLDEGDRTAVVQADVREPTASAATRPPAG